MTAQPHADRGHAAWSASATARNWTCSGALAMSALAGPDKESEHAARGTAAHELAEWCLQNAAHNAIDLLGTIFKTKSHEITIDEEIVNSAQEFVDYVRAQNFDSLLIEKNLSLAAIKPPFEAGGTCDAIGVKFADALLEVIDLKNGMGVVEVAQNKQTRTYALCALLDMPQDVISKIDRIKVTIVQPRAPHKDGRIRSEEFAVADLIEWTVELLDRMNRSKQAKDEFDKIAGNRVVFDEWADKWLTTGACTFCPAEAMCPKRRKDALAVAGQTAAKWFEEPADAPLVIGNAPQLASPEELSHWLDGLEALEGWIKAVRAHAHHQAEAGVAIPDHGLVDKIGFRAFIEKDEAKLVKQIKKDLSLTDDQVFERSVRSVAQIEKVLGAKRKNELAKLEGALWHKPVKGTNLVRLDKTTRPAAKTKAEQFFEAVEN